MSNLTRLNEADRKFQEDLQKQRDRSENAILFLSILFAIHTIFSYLLINSAWIDDYFVNVNSTKLYAFVYIENVIFGIIIVLLFNKYKY